MTQGVTTIFTGNCGHGFTSLDSWSNFLQDNQFGINIGHFIPYGSLRKEVLGKENTEKYLRKDSIKRICKRIENEMEKGAWGLSTSFDSRPSCYAETSELVEYAKIIKKYNGKYITHIRNESGVGIIASINEAIQIGEESGSAIHLSQFRLYKPTMGVTSDKILELVYRARKHGINITASQNPYDSIAAPLNYYLIGNLLSNIEGMVDYDMLKEESALTTAVEKVLTVFSPESILIIDHDLYAGKTIQEVAEITSKDPVEVTVKLCMEKDNTSAIVYGLDNTVMEELMNHEFVFTSSNGSLCIDGTKHHPRSFGTFPRKIREYSLTKRLIGFNEVICSMTSKPAEFLNLRKRGKIEVEYYADIVILNKNSIMDKLNYLVSNQYSQGIEYVLVNGKLVINKENIQEKLHGEILYYNAQA